MPFCAYLYLICRGAANRIRQNFDFDWQFRLGENGDFREVQLPHDWSVELDFDEKAGGASGYLPGGIGWYRKSFMIPASYKNQKVSLVFDGIYHKATIFLNGKEIAYHRYGYTSFETDLTPFLKYGESNDLKIKVESFRNFSLVYWFRHLSACLVASD